MVVRATPVRASWDVPARWRETPVEDLLAYHNLGKPFRRHERAGILVAACMDPRVSFRLPEGFAYVIRVGGANLTPVVFNVSYAIAVKGVAFAAVVGHTGCGTVGLLAKRAEFVEGLVSRGGWTREAAEKHFDLEAPFYDLADPATYALRSAKRLATEYPRLSTVGLLYDLSDGMLSVLEE